MADYETILYEEKDGVAWVTLNRPDVHNAFNARMQRELRETWRSLRGNDEVRCIVLTGAGEKAFCTGIDRSEAMGGERPDDLTIGSGSTPFMFDDPGENIGPKSNDLWKPVIAAVNGMACGGAFYMLGEVEFIIAAEHATFFDPHVTYGMTAAFEPIHMLQKMPFSEIMRLSLLGNHERMSAQRAFQIGLVSEVVSVAALHETAAWAAGAIASAPALAVQGTLRAIWTGLELTRTQALEQAYGYIAMGTNQDSIAEGQAFFASGRRIDWRLR
ncbi:MAG: enoyl-CoA hydratase/isomerase family protein [Acidimicrobiia bacterium]|nr:enoyl-CoA hydratase/isomerase family protein [Acidimicrobiia bacterium]